MSGHEQAAARPAPKAVPAHSVRGAAQRGAVARPGAEAIAVKGWLRAHKWLLLRRLSQLGILALFLACGCLWFWLLLCKLL